MTDYPAHTVQKVVITHALRSPIGGMGGALGEASAVELGAQVAKGLLRAAALRPERIDEVILGQAWQAGAGPNPARAAAQGAGIPAQTTAFSVNMGCASGLKAILLGCQAIVTGKARIVLAGGMESSTLVPFLLPRMRSGYRLGHGEVLDGLVRDGSGCAPTQEALIDFTETFAREHHLGREAQDAYAAASCERCLRARAEGWWRAEIQPIEGRAHRSRALLVEVDEHPREAASARELAELAPISGRRDGTVTAASTAAPADGAAAVLLMALEDAQRYGYSPLARVGPALTLGVEPHRGPAAVAVAIERLCDGIGTSAGAFDLVEIDESTAAQMLVCAKELNIPSERLNPQGGALAMGHPAGAAGARLAVTLVHAMKRRAAARGLVGLNADGGLGIAAAFYRYGD